MDNIPYGYCHCGCGEKTKLAPRNNTSKGWIAGQPLLYLRHHVNRQSGPEYVEKDRGHETPCWIWQGSLSKTGYGVKWLSKQRDGQHSTRAHRYMWEKEYGPVPGGHVLHHLCRVRPCCRPTHCTPVIHSDHARDHQTKLSEEGRLKVVRLYATSKFTGDEIGQMFGICQARVSTIAIEAGVRRARPNKV